ncbi:peptidase M28 [Polaribacter sp. WD7]|uniref:M28 family metallopeptidase n=1 Tax=Polaribacter sp. WD7 TaxID=2269061 RepID=UPI000DF365B7|nr:M28 family metallopeptidase [Polaribacter sp. WD7]RCS27204.1 peptidase M28 [Polaribacter sp. WD7]
MKKIIFLLSVIALTGCASNIEATKFAKRIKAKDLQKHLYIYASDEFEGRDTGEPGQKKAVEYLRNYYTKNKITAAKGTENYFQPISSAWLTNASRRGSLKDSENVLAFIEGSEKPEEIIVISAHLDHVGTENGEIYNGADDDGSGTVAILEIAEAFKKAAKKGNGPKRSILFLHVTGEEKGLLGSRYYTEHPIFPLANTVANLNIDMIGRVDKFHQTDSNYVYLIGSDKLSTELHEISENINKKYANINLDYKYNDDNDPNRFYYRSDHYNFAKHNIPVIFYFNGTHADYHKPTDTPDKINYELLEKRARLIFHTAWEIANRKERIIVDKAVTKK